VSVQKTDAKKDRNGQKKNGTGLLTLFACSGLFLQRSFVQEPKKVIVPFSSYQFYRSLFYFTFVIVDAVFKNILCHQLLLSSLYYYSFAEKLKLNQFLLL